MSITIIFAASDSMDPLTDAEKIIKITAKPHQTLMHAAVKAGVKGIAADCGGCLTCATCHVFVNDPSAFPPPSADEAAMLDMTASPRLPSSRLSCQLVLRPEHTELRFGLPEKQY